MNRFDDLEYPLSSHLLMGDVVSFVDNGSHSTTMLSTSSDRISPHRRLRHGGRDRILIDGVIGLSHHWVPGSSRMSRSSNNYIVVRITEKTPANPGG